LEAICLAAALNVFVRLGFGSQKAFLKKKNGKTNCSSIASVGSFWLPRICNLTPIGTSNVLSFSPKSLDDFDRMLRRDNLAIGR